ncbi:AtpZ/AtpI family protein [Granulicella cerasi]|uniref:AtpZ/AtpI family protein n=1 Tax=Granulicella cerasi TaxID=741063 RepID=A0ABW1Z4L8_9BACT|nr:AtpZ/AtpI family protein [Granulicella cerasi]
MADEQQPKKAGALGDLVKAESMIQLALVLPIGCVLGWLIGHALDEHFHLGDVCGIIGIVMGAIGGFIQIFRTAQKYLKGK